MVVFVEQPFDEVAVTVYTDEVVGTKATLFVAELMPLLHEYVLAPVALNVMDEPTQTELPGEAVTLIEGIALIVIVAGNEVLLQPNEFV